MKTSATTKSDAGEVGAGHTLTALYEIALADGPGQRIEPLRYGQSKVAGGSESNELAFLRLRYKLPAENQSKLLEFPVTPDSVKGQLASTSANFRFAGAVAAFGQMLRGGEYLESLEPEELIDLANDARGKDRFGYRGEFIGLVRTAMALQTEPKAIAAGR